MYKKPDRGSRCSAVRDSDALHKDVLVRVCYCGVMALIPLLTLDVKLHCSTMHMAQWQSEIR